ncbi:MAG: polysaccharide deacetylase family protein [Anaerolineae bacterium]|nr:polysaccharide deacetylase family protein [Anaerolineae bacterium]
MNSTGYFVFSLDTELATGYFDHDPERRRLFSQDGIRERERIDRILSLCSQYQIHGTWAVVGHLFFERCEFCEICPVRAWKGMYASYQEAYGTAHPLWYGADVIRKIQACPVDQEIGFHGYTHSVFSQVAMTDEQAAVEIQEWKRLALRYGIDGKSIVFPRDQIGHLRQLREAGFDNFREDIHLPLLIRNRYFGRYVKTIDHILGITTAPSYPLDLNEEEGLVRFTTSQELFAFNRAVDRVLDKMGLPLLRIQRAIRGVHRAAKRGKIFHLWAHPWEFETTEDLAKLEAIFQAVAEEREHGRMASKTMLQLSQILRNGPQ